MRVRVVDDIQAHARDGLLHQDLRPGAVYEVLGVEQGFLRLAGERDDPCLYPIEILELIDPTIPSGWVIEIEPGDLNEDGSIDDATVDMGPAEFMDRCFWERFHDGVPEAIETYRRFKERNQD